LVAVSVDEATPRVRLLVDQVEVAANSEDPQLALVALELVAAASVVASVDEVVVVAALAVIEEVSEAASVAEAAVVVVTLVAVAEELGTSPTAMDLPMALQQVLAVHEVVAAAATEAEVDDTTTDVAAAVAATIVDPAAPTTNPSAAETDIATATVGTVVEVETTAQGSADTKATATTIRDSAADTKPILGLKSCLLQGFVKGYLPFLRLHPPFLVFEGKMEIALTNLTLDYSTQPPDTGQDGKGSSTCYL
jgi:hypothetical protein